MASEEIAEGHVSWEVIITYSFGSAPKLTWIIKLDYFLGAWEGPTLSNFG